MNLPVPNDDRQLEEVPDQTMMDVAASRGAQEVQAMVVMAKKFPRNQIVAEKRILDACKRKGLADASQYSFPRGGQTVEGPSIRLAEVLAQNWGNLDYGTVELDRRDGVSTMMAYCWDIETNVRKTQVFTVAHKRDTRGGGKRLTEERDIYEMTANTGARRVRACILAVIPGDIVEAAVAQCDRTSAGGDAARPMKDRVSEMVKQFENYGVTLDLIEKYLGHPLSVERMTEPEMLKMKKVFLTLKDGAGKPEDFFQMPKQIRDEDKPDMKKKVEALTQGVNEIPANAEAVAALMTGRPQTFVNHEAGLFDSAPAPKLNGEK